MITYLTMPRWHDVLLEIYKARERDCYCERLNRRVRASLTHVREIVRLLADNGLIEILPGARTKRIALTEKGRRIAASILDLRSELGRRTAQHDDI